MVGGDRIDRAVGETLFDRLDIHVGAQWRVHLKMGS
jgi:hypothetical protein